MLSIKNWTKFQHYQTGRGAPPWIKLYRDLLNDRNWHLLEPEAAKFLVSCWLIASENEGNLPDIETLAFRLRLASKEIAKLVSLCKDWIISDDSNVLADCYQDATPETETDTETDKKRINSPKQVRTSDPDGFLDFYSRYPRKTGKGKAVKAWQKAIRETSKETIMQGLERFRFSPDRQFIPEPSAWLNAQRWLDEFPDEETGEVIIPANRWGKAPDEMTPQELEEWLAEQRRAAQ